MKFTKNQSAEIMVNAIETEELQSDIETTIEAITGDSEKVFLSDLDDGFKFLCEWLPIMGNYQLRSFKDRLQSCLNEGSFYAGVEKAQLTEDEEDAMDMDAPSPIINLAPADDALFQRLLKVVGVILHHRANDQQLQELLKNV